MQTKEKTWVEISQSNILHNIKSLKTLLSPNTKFMAILKSNAYGHGIGKTNKICVQSKLIDWFGVDSLDEALLLRRLNNTRPILILGYVPLERVGEAIREDISFVVYNMELLDFLEHSFQNKKNFQVPISNSQKAKIHIKVETGTSRQGIANEKLIEFIKKAVQNKNILIEGIYTHFANIEDTTDPNYAMKQLAVFNSNIKKVEQLGVDIPKKHSACSAAIINYPKTHFDMVRTGISLYGFWSSNETKLVAKQKNVELKLKPAITWKTKIIQIKNLPKGTPVSYGLTETLKRNSKLAILPIGYWDGYDRGLSSIGEVLICGKRARVLGRVCMNMIIVDITDIPKAGLFDEVVLLGKQQNDQITAEELAKKLNTINYEVITRINPLIKRIIV